MMVHMKDMIVWNNNMRNVTHFSLHMVGEMIQRICGPTYDTILLQPWVVDAWRLSELLLVASSPMEAILSLPGNLLMLLFPWMAEKYLEVAFTVSLNSTWKMEAASEAILAERWLISIISSHVGYNN